MYNTMGLVRSLGRCNVDIYLLCASMINRVSIAHSKYIKRNQFRCFSSFEEVMPILDQIKLISGEKFIICTFDAAAEWVDEHEVYLSEYFVTPCRGKRLGNLFNKSVQCQLADKCGLTAPYSFNYTKGDNIDYADISYPVLTKPLVSAHGSKSDIHICQSSDELKGVLENEPVGKSFIIQEFIEKEYELNVIGCRTDDECVLAGAIRKLRVYPKTYGASSYAQINPLESCNLNIDGIKQFIDASGYYGPFSIEFLHKGTDNYFMEVNFRNDGLAYTATCAGMNLYDLYIHRKLSDTCSLKPIHMMNVNFDFNLWKKTKEFSLFTWLKQFFQAECHLDFCMTDPMPMLCRPLDFILRRLSL